MSREIFWKVIQGSPDVGLSGAGKRIDAPNDANAHNFYSKYLTATGQIDQAFSEQKKAQELDPLSVNFITNVTRELYFARRYDEAIAQCQKALEMDRHFFWAHYTLGQTYEKQGMFDEAITALERAVNLSQEGDALLRRIILAVIQLRKPSREPLTIAMTRMRIVMKVPAFSSEGN
jgi:tetratricopeptide (TPR) repeat protein